MTTVTSAAESLLTQARTQLSRQEAAVDTIRTRATAVFSGSGVVAGLFATQVLSQRAVSAWTYAAFSLVFVGAVATIVILAPRHMTFTEQLDEWMPWLGSAASWPADARDEAAAAGLAENLNELWKLNRQPIENLANAYVVLCVVFGLQVATWVVAGVLT